MLLSNSHLKRMNSSESPVCQKLFPGSSQIRGGEILGSKSPGGLNYEQWCQHFQNDYCSFFPPIHQVQGVRWGSQVTPELGFSAWQLINVTVWHQEYGVTDFFFFYLWTLAIKHPDTLLKFHVENFNRMPSVILLRTLCEHPSPSGSVRFTHSALVSW